MSIGRIQQSPSPPIIPDISLNGGINRGNIFPPPGRGVLAIARPFAFREGDTVSVHWGDPDRPAAQVVVPPGQNGPITIQVPADAVRLRTGTVDVWYTIFTPTTDTTITSQVQPVLVDFDIPGDPDPVQSTPTINENLVPIEGLDGIVVPGQPLPITIPRWKFTQRGDRLSVDWGSQNIVVTIEDDLGEAGPPVQIDVPWSIAGNGPAFVTYHIIDLVNNHSLWAESVLFDVGGSGRHPPPTLLGTDEFDNLPIDELNFGPAGVDVRYPQPGTGDVVVLSWSGTTKEGITPPPTTYTYTWPTPAPVKHTFSIPYDQVSPFVGGEVRTSYTVQPFNTQPPPTPSGITRALVTGTPVNLPRPTVAEANGTELDPALLDEGATVQVATDYDFATGTDRITMFWRGESADGSLVVSDQQTRRNDEATNNVLEFVVPTARIVPVAGGRAVVRYEVLTPANITVPSDELDLTIRAGTGVTPLQPPTVDGTAPDDSLDPDDVGATLIVRVPANASLPLDNDIFVTWQGTVGPGSTVTPPKAVSTTGMRFDLDKSLLAPNAGLTVNVFYTLSGTGGVPGPSSGVRPILVLEGDTIGNLPAPGVREAQGGQLDPVSAPQGCTVMLPVGADIQPGDSVVVTFGASSLAPGAGPTFLVPPEEVARYLGQSITVVYTVTRGNARKTSDVLPLQVLDLATENPGVLRPVIVEASGGFVLDLSLFVGDATARVPQWPLMARGQTCWLRAIAGGTSQTLINGEAIAVVAPLQRAVPRPWLEQLPNNTPLTLELKIGFDGGGETTARTFTSPSYNVTRGATDMEFDFETVTPPFRDFSSHEDQTNPLRFPGVFAWRFDVVPTAVQYIGVKTTNPPFVEDFYFRNVLRIGDDSQATNVAKRVLCEMEATWTRVRFAVSTINNPFSVSFQDENRIIVGTVLDFGASPSFREVLSVEATTRKIKYIEIRCVDTIHLDFFRFTQ